MRFVQRVEHFPGGNIPRTIFGEKFRKRDIQSRADIAEIFHGRTFQSQFELMNIRRLNAGAVGKRVLRDIFLFPEPSDLFPYFPLFHLLSPSVYNF